MTKEQETAKGQLHFEIQRLEDCMSQLSNLLSEVPVEAEGSLWDAYFVCQAQLKELNESLEEVKMDIEIDTLLDAPLPTREVNVTKAPEAIDSFATVIEKQLELDPSPSGMTKWGHWQSYKIFVEEYELFNFITSFEKFESAMYAQGYYKPITPSSEPDLDF